MQIPDSPAPAEPTHFYDVDELGNLVRRSLDARTGRLERVSEVLWSVSGGGRV